MLCALIAETAETTKTNERDDNKRRLFIGSQIKVAAIGGSLDIVMLALF
jgi:hypothetical protein